MVLSSFYILAVTNYSSFPIITSVDLIMMHIRRATRRPPVPTIYADYLAMCIMGTPRGCHQIHYTPKL